MATSVLLLLTPLESLYTYQPALELTADSFQAKS